MKELARLYGHGTVGMIVVLDHVHLSEESPCGKYVQPAFFTIVEAPESNASGFDASYVLRDTAGRLVDTKGCQGTACYLSKVDDWSDWRDEQAKDARVSNAKTIDTLRDRVALQKSILVEQGFRVISNEQALTLGIKA